MPLTRPGRRGILRSGGIAALAMVLPRRARAATPDSEIRVGMSGALSGPSQSLGLGIKSGIEAYFTLVNASGGVDQRKLRLIAVDDAYEPGRTGPNMRRLIDDEKVFGILGNQGTPTAVVAVPIAKEKRIPFFGAFTGAGLLRKTPPDRYVVNYRASYAQETAEMVRGLVTEMRLRPQDIGFFTQNDAYGDSGWSGAVAALKKLGYDAADRLPHGRYQRNTLDVEGALARMLDPTVHPRAIIMIGVYRPCAKFIRLARKNGLRAVFVNVSFVIGDALNLELDSDGDGVVVTQVVPPLDGDLPVLAEYRGAVPSANRSFISLEGFIAAKAFVQTLLRAGPGASREQFIDGLESGHPFDLGLGVKHVLSKDNHQFSDRVWPTVIRGGKIRPLVKCTDLLRVG